VCGGNLNDPDPTMSGGVRVILPHLHNPKNVKIKDLPFARTMAQGTQKGMTNMNMPAEHGAGVLCLKMPGQAGTGHLSVLATVSGDIAEDEGTPGNNNPFSDFLRKVMQDSAGINIPPSVGSGPGGSKPPVEKGEEWRHELAKYLPSHLALAPLIGIKIPQLKNVSTAIQSFSSILTGDMLSKLPGVNMTLGSLLTNMPSNLLNDLAKNMSPDMYRALNSMNKLMQTMEIVEAGGFNTAAKINPDVFFNNAVNLLADTRTIYDLVGSYQKLQYDTSLFGLESLPPVDLIMSGGPFGNIPMQLDAFGNLTSNAPEGVQKLIEAFSSLMKDTSGGFPGVFPDKNMFGGSSGVLNEMFNRLPTEELNKAVQQMQKNVAPGTNPRKNGNIMAEASVTAATLGLAFLNSKLS
jgi:hypothetical protein